MANTQYKLGYGNEESIASAIEKGLVDGGDIVVTKDTHRLAFIYPNDEKTVVFLKSRLETFESLEDAYNYINGENKSSIYEGELVTIKTDDDTYETFKVKVGESENTLENIDKKYIRVVDAFPEVNQKTGVIYICGTVGKMWTGSEWDVLFDEESLREYVDKNIKIATTSISDEEIFSLFDLSKEVFVYQKLNDYIEGNLTEIESDVTSVCNGGFAQHTEITKISVPKAESIGANAFSGCTSLTEVNLDGAESIGANAFNGTAVTKLSLPKVTELDTDALTGSSIEEIDSNGLKTISENMFAKNTNLKTVSFSSATTIETGAFSYDNNLINVSFPEVTTIGASAFFNCFSPEYSCKDYHVSPASLDGEEINTASVDDTTLNDESEDDYELYEVSFPKVTEIGECAFQMATQLSKATFPLITKIPSYCFNKTSFTEVTRDMFPLVTEIGKNAFNYSFITSVDLPNVTIVGNDAFCECFNLTSVSLPLATTIGDNAFEMCTNLATLSLPIAENFGIYCFSCTSLTEITQDMFPRMSQFTEGMFNSCLITKASFPTITTIPSNCFAHNNFVNLSDFQHVTEISSDSFYHCPMLENVDLPLLTSIPEAAFGNCDKIIKITSESFPLVTEIGNRAFEGCTALISISFPQAISLGSSAFQTCTSLTDVSLPLVTSLGDWAFMRCSSLTKINLPLITRLNYLEFSYCTNLVEASFSNLTYIDSSGIFSNCYNLKQFILRSDTICTLAGTNAFSNCHHLYGTYNGTYNPNRLKDGYIYVPKALVEEYKSATNWSRFATQFRALEDYTVDGTTTGELDETKI